MKILGYKPYHTMECINSGIPHMEVFGEAIFAQHNRYSGIKRYAKEDFQKWLAEYDVSSPFHYAQCNALAGDMASVILVPDGWMEICSA